MSNSISVSKAELAEVLTEIAQAVREHNPESLDHLASTLQAEHDEVERKRTGKIPVSTSGILTGRTKTLIPTPNSKPGDFPKLEEQDFSDLENRVTASLGGDFGLSPEVLKGKDPHRDRAAKILSIPVEQVTEEQRRLGKSINWYDSYCMSTGDLLQQLKSTMDIKNPN